MLKTLKNILIYLFFPVIFTMLFINDISNKLYMPLIFIGHIIILIYFYFVYKDIFINDFKTFKRKYIKTIFLYWIIGFILMVISNFIINLIIPNGISNNEQANIDMLINNKLLYSIMLCFIIPFIEEVVFRIELKKKYKNKYIFVLLSSLIFALLHLLSNNNLIELLYFIPYFILGITFSLIYFKNDNIYSNILAHMLHNSVIVIYYLIFL